MKIVNLTPHNLVLLREGGDLPVVIGRGPSARNATVRVLVLIAPSGVVAGAPEVSQDASPIVIGGHDIPVIARTGAPTNLPDPVEGTTLFVSAITVAAAVAAGRSVADLVMPGQLATDMDGKPFGVLSLARQG